MSRKDVEMGPLWNNDDATEKANIWVSQNPGWRYTGEWRTTIPNVMSTITVEMVQQPMMQQPMMQPMMQQPMMMQQPQVVVEQVMVPQPIYINAGQPQLPQ